MVEDIAQVDIASLVADYYQAVYRYAYRLCGSPSEAEDLTQQTYLIASRSLKQLRSADRAKSWLFTILRNHFLRTRQTVQRMSAEIPCDMNSLPAHVPDELEIEPERLQETLNALPDISRVVLGMFYYEDCSYKQIAEQLGLPVGTVMSRLARAKAELRARLLGQNKPTRQPRSKVGAS